MQSTTIIEIAGDLDEIVAMAAAVERWPEILPHYRWVTVLEGSGDRRTVEMAARRDWFPVKWQAVQEVRRDGATPVIPFKHVRGVTKGMDVAWTFEPAADRVRVQIWHGFDPPWPLVGNFQSLAAALCLAALAAARHSAATRAPASDGTGGGAPPPASFACTLRAFFPSPPTKCVSRCGATIPRHSCFASLGRRRSPHSSAAGTRASSQAGRRKWKGKGQDAAKEKGVRKAKARPCDSVSAILEVSGFRSWTVWRSIETSNATTNGHQ